MKLSHLDLFWIFFGSFFFKSWLIKIVARTKMAAGLHDDFVSNDYSLAQRTPVVLRT